jgi:hypothetical protein
MFSVDTYVYAYFKLEIVIRAKELPQPVTLKATIDHRTTLNNIRNSFKKGINAYNKIIQDHETVGKKDIASKLKKDFSSRPPLKFDLQKEDDGSYVIVLNSPVEIKSTQKNGFVIFSQ